MSLPSQAGRMAGGRGVTARTRRRRRRKLPAVVVVGVGAAVIAGLAFIGWSLMGSGPSAASAGQGGTLDTGELASGGASGERDDGFGGAAPTPERDEPDEAVTRIDRPSITPPALDPAPARGGLLRDAVQSPAQPADTTASSDGDTPPAEPADEPTPRVVDAAPQPTTQPTPQPTTQTQPRATGGASSVLAEADALVAAGDRASDADLIGVRDKLWTMSRGEVPPPEVRTRLAALNQIIVFSPRVVAGDTLTGTYTVRSGDSLARISNRESLVTHWKLIQRVNGLSNPNRIRVGQSLKVVRGPFHAVVRKGAYRLDLYHGPPSEPGRWKYVRSFDVGLGAGDSTPTGSFVISDNKLENPGWVNPRDSRERYAPDDPGNPIGEFWLGLDGIGPSAGVTGYGIHGTIDPSSIGHQASMGCVRLRSADIELLYELLEEQISVVHIVD